MGRPRDKFDEDDEPDDIVIEIPPPLKARKRAHRLTLPRLEWEALREDRRTYLIRPVYEDDEFAYGDVAMINEIDDGRPSGRQAFVEIRDVLRLDLRLDPLALEATPHFLVSVRRVT